MPEGRAELCRVWRISGKWSGGSAEFDEFLGAKGDRPRQQAGVEVVSIDVMATTGL